MLADELQFQTQSMANTQIAKHLMVISRVGPPVVYAGNFSLLHRLVRRPQEERDRLLSKFIMIYPDACESDDWRNYVNEILKVSEEFSKLDKDQFAEILHRYTFGIKRAVIRLLSTAYSLMRECDQNYVGIRHIEAAYQSLDYASTKENIENLLAGSLNSALLNQDLKCPLHDAKYTKEFSKILAHPAANNQKERVGAAAVISMLNPEERLAYDQLADSQDISTKQARNKRPAPTLENLIGGAEKFSKK